VRAELARAQGFSNVQSRGTASARRALRPVAAEHFSSIPAATIASLACRLAARFIGSPRLAPGTSHVGQFIASIEPERAAEKKRPRSRASRDSRRDAGIFDARTHLCDDAHVQPLMVRWPPPAGDPAAYALASRNSRKHPTVELLAAQATAVPFGEAGGPLKPRVFAIRLAVATLRLGPGTDHVNDGERPSASRTRPHEIT
jgi:hypothetical protein